MLFGGMQGIAARSLWHGGWDLRGWAEDIGVDGERGGGERERLRLCLALWRQEPSYNAKGGAEKEADEEAPAAIQCISVSGLPSCHSPGNGDRIAHPFAMILEVSRIWIEEVVENGGGRFP